MRGEEHTCCDAEMEAAAGGQFVDLSGREFPSLCYSTVPLHIVFRLSDLDWITDQDVRVDGTVLRTVVGTLDLCVWRVPIHSFYMIGT